MLTLSANALVLRYYGSLIDAVLMLGRRTYPRNHFQPLGRGGVSHI